MTLIDRIAAMLGYTKAQRKPLPPTWMSQTADYLDTEPPADLEVHYDLYEKLSWLQVAIGRVADTAASAKFEVFKHSKEKESAIQAHDFEKLLQNPNPDTDRHQLMHGTFLYLSLGAAAWWLNRSGPDVPPDEIWLIPPHQLRAVPDERMSVRGYLYNPGDGREIPLEPWEVVHFRKFNPKSRYIGLPTARAVDQISQGDIAMQRWNRNLFAKDNAKLPGALAFSDPIDDVTWRTIKQDINDQHGGTKRSLMMLRNVGQGGVQWLNMALSQTEMQFLESRVANKEEIFALFAPGLASVLAVNATEANAVAGKRTFIEFGVWPTMTAVAERITSQILPSYGDDLVGRFEDIRVTDRALKLQEMNAYAMVHTVDEVRKEFYQAKPIGDYRGDLLLAEIPQGITPDPDAEEPAPPPQSPAQSPFDEQAPEDPSSPQEPQDTAIGPDAVGQDLDNPDAPPEDPQIEAKSAELRRYRRWVAKRIWKASFDPDAFESPFLTTADRQAVLAEAGWHTWPDHEFFDATKGGPGSGNWGHDGRRGQRGGSRPGGGLHLQRLDPASTVDERKQAFGVYRQFVPTLSSPERAAREAHVNRIVANSGTVGTQGQMRPFVGEAQTEMAKALMMHDSRVLEQVKQIRVAHNAAAWQAEAVAAGMKPASAPNVLGFTYAMKGQAGYGTIWLQSYGNSQRERMTLHHEIGHTVYGATTQQGRQDWIDFYNAGGNHHTAYSGTNRAEGFSESYAGWLWAKGTQAPDAVTRSNLSAVPSLAAYRDTFNSVANVIAAIPASTPTKAARITRADLFGDVKALTRTNLLAAHESTINVDWPKLSAAAQSQWQVRHEKSDLPGVPGDARVWFADVVVAHDAAWQGDGNGKSLFIEALAPWVAALETAQTALRGKGPLKAGFSNPLRVASARWESLPPDRRRQWVDGYDDLDWVGKPPHPVEGFADAVVAHRALDGASPDEMMDLEGFQPYRDLFGRLGTVLDPKPGQSAAPTKGGPGSGNFGHKGRPGFRGGSVAGGGLGAIGVDRTATPDERRNAAAAFRQKAPVTVPTQDPKRAKLLASTTFEAFGSTDAEVDTALSSIGLTREDVTYMMALDGFNGEVASFLQGGKLFVAGEYTLESNPNVTATVMRGFYQEGDEWHVDHMKFGIDGIHHGRGTAQDLYARQIETYKAAGIVAVHTHADIDVGRYAWAKMGFEYDESGGSNIARKTKQFEHWAKKLGIDPPDGGWPTFQRPHDFATYKHPDGRKVNANDMGNWQGKFLPGDYDIGKAFMLDDNGHGDWYGVLPLKGQP